MLARVKQAYLAGSVIAFSGREYIRSEWRAVPEGFEEQAKTHPLLDTQPSLDEVRAGSSKLPGLGKDAPEEPAVSVETPEPQATEPPAEEPPAEETKTKCRGKRAGTGE